MSDKHALYRFYGDTGTLLYTGITNNPARRFTQHSASKEWWAYVRGISIDWYDSRDEAEAAERRAIHVEQPRHNVVRPAPRPTGKRCGHCEECRDSAPCLNEEAINAHCDCEDRTCWAYTGGYREGLMAGFDKGFESGNEVAARNLMTFILDKGQHARAWSTSVAVTILDDLEKHNLTIEPITNREEGPCASEPSNLSSGVPQTSAT